MKTYLLLAIATLGLASCSKNNDPQPEAAAQVVYNIECDHCLVYLEDNQWNHTRTITQAQTQHFNVSGSFRYAFENTTDLDSVSLKVYATDYQKVITNVSYKGKHVGYGIFMGNGSPENITTKTVTLKLK